MDTGMSMNERDFLDSAGGDRHPAFKFTVVGDVCKGTVADASRVITTNNMNTGQPEQKIVIGVALEPGSVSGGQPCNAGEVVSVWVKAGFAASALRDAYAKADASQAQVGGRFAMKLVELRDTGKPQPAKVYAAQYEAPSQLAALDEPAVGVDVGELL